MNKKRVILLVVISFVCVLSIATTLAFFTSSDSVLNRFVVGDIKVDIEEPGFQEPDNWDGGVYTKVVQIKNTGKNECFLRVSIIPRWVDTNGNPWTGDVSSKVINLGFTNVIASETPWTANKWVYGEDGFYYYTSKLPVNELTSQLLNNVTATVNGSTVEYPEDYKGKQLKVDVKAEAVQTTGDAYNTVWKVPDKIKPLFQGLTSN